MNATIQVVTEQLENNGYNFDDLKLSGWAYFLIGDYTEALKDFSLAININPKDHDLFLIRGKIKVNMDKYFGGIKD